MKHTILTLAAAAMLFTACGTKQETVKEEPIRNNVTTMDFKNVSERVNMGAKLYVTPQPALMIATYDAEGTPDVMMAAWGGQYEGNQVCFQLSSHQTTDNLRLTKAFTLSYADARTVAQAGFYLHDAHVLRPAVERRKGSAPSLHAPCNPHFIPMGRGYGQRVGCRLCSRRYGCCNKHREETYTQ
jgi:hypothetical protein